MKVKVFAFVLAFALLFCGCMDVESYLQPPRVGGQQQAIQETLSSALGDAYTLKYASLNNKPSAFVLLDAAGAVTESDDASVAVAFYTPRGSERTRLALLHRENNAWVVAADVQGEGVNPHIATVSDLDGDGVMELLLGWELFSNDYQLSIYRLDNALTAVKDAGRYTTFLTGDMNADTKADIILLHIGTAATATVCSYADNAVTAMGTVVLRDGVRSFEKTIFGYIMGGGNGVYADVQLTTDTYATTLVYWDGQQLVAPLFDAQTGNVAIADRIPAISIMDADGNGVPEIPVATRLSDVEQALPQDTWCWLAEWYTWDITTNTAVRQFNSIVNRADGYSIELEENWADKVITRYAAGTRTLWLEQETEQGKTPFLAVQNTAELQGGVSDAEEYVFETLPGDLPLKIWYASDAPFYLTTEKISYMLVKL